jgi:demethylmenaquinone methyltransferase/2-methoxy-6-polyprenyl-1,4-benzoquinol methylase
MTLGVDNPEYGILSKVYGLFDLIFLFGGKGNPRKGLIEEIPNRKISVLEVCVGTAENAIRIAKTNPMVRIIGIDISEDMLKVANKKIKKAKILNVEIRIMSAAELKFPSNNFDVAIISFALHEIEKAMRESIYKEIARVLRPSGKLFVIDFARQKGMINRLFLALWKTIEPACFQEFLSTDWKTGLAPVGLKYEKEMQYSFSNVYVLRKE